MSSTTPSMVLGVEGLVVAWHAPLGPAVAWFDSWAREEPRFARTIGHPGAELPLAPALWVRSETLVAFHCEEEGAFATRLTRADGGAARPVLLVPGARSVAVVPFGERAILFCADAQGLVPLAVDERGHALGEPRRAFAWRGSDVLLAAARVQDTALLVYAHRGEPRLGVIAVRGEEAVVVRHALPAPCDDLAIASAGARAAIALELAGGKVRVGSIAADGRMIERPHAVDGLRPGALASPRVVWSETDFTLLARDGERLRVHPLGDGGERFSLPRCGGPFAAGYWMQHFFALEIDGAAQGSELRLWRCARDGSAPQQRVLALTLADAPRRTRGLAARRALESLRDRAGTPSAYRERARSPELSRDVLSWLDDEGRLGAGLAPADEGFVLRVTSAVGDDPRLPEATSSLVRLARWVRERLSPAARAVVSAEREWAQAQASALGGALRRFDRAGTTLVLELELAALPATEVLDEWLRQLRREQVERFAPPAG